MFKITNNDNGSLKVGNVANRQFLPGDRIHIVGEKDVRTVTFVMGKGERQHLCFKKQGILPKGEVEFALVDDSYAVPSEENVEPDFDKALYIVAGKDLQDEELEEPTPCERCEHSCPVDRICEKCGGDPMQPGDQICVECDREELELNE